MKIDENVDKEIEDIEDDFEDYYDDKEENTEEKVEKKEVKTKATKKKKTKKEETKEEIKEVDLDINNDSDFDFDDDDEDSFKFGGLIKYLVVLVLGALIMTGLLHFGGFLGDAETVPASEKVDCPVCEECEESPALDCPEPQCPKLTSQRCKELFG